MPVEQLQTSQRKNKLFNNDSKNSQHFQPSRVILKETSGGAESYLAHQRRVGINKPNSGVTALAHQHGSAGEQ